MNQKRRGFTLIELLAVIVILAIIALIAVPVIMNIIDKANKSAFKDTAYGVIQAGELYYAEQLLEPNGMTSDVTITLPDATKKLQIKGEVPTGSILITTEGKVAIAVQNGRYCVTKGLEDDKVTMTEDIANCILPSDSNQPGSTLSDLATTSTEVTSKPVCLDDGTICAPGTPVAIKVNASEVYNFYIISDENNEVTLIMDRNLGNNVAWINASDYAKANADDNTLCDYDACADEGPITAIKHLKERTSGWSNIPEREYTYTDDGSYADTSSAQYNNVTETMRARMLTNTELAYETIECKNNPSLCPDWLYENLDETEGYWLTSTTKISPWEWGAESMGSGTWGVYEENYNGIRPVITLTK